MPNAKNPRNLACTLILASVSLLGGCDHIKYHITRVDPVPVAEFNDEFACELAVDEIKRRVPLASRAALDVKGALLSCSKKALQDPAQAKALDAQEELRRFIGKTLPLEWFRKGYVRSEPPQIRAHVEVTARSPAPESKEAAKAFATTLSDRGQQALIEYVAKQDTKDPKDSKSTKDSKAVEKLLGVLRDKGPAEVSTGSFDTRRSIPLLISTSFNSHRPADRLEKVYIFIQPLGGSQIIDVDKVSLETVRGLAAFGKEITTQEASPSLVLEGIPFGDKITGKGGVASSKLGRQLERTLTRQYALRTVSLSAPRDILIIRQEGQEGTDVTGSVLSTISLQLPLEPGVLTVFSVDKPEEIAPATPDARGTTAKPAADHANTGDSGKSKPKLPSITQSSRSFINVGDVDAAVTWIAVTRLVKSGAHTITEEDDEVEPWVFAKQFKTRLWSNELVLYTLRLRHLVGAACRSVPLMYHDPNREQMRLMVFKDFASLVRFKAYLRTQDFKFPPGSKDTSIEVMTKDGKISVGFPIAANGLIDPKVLNFDWQPRAASPDVIVRRVQSLDFDTSEPKYFPLRDGQPDMACE